MNKVARFLAATTLALGSLLLSQPSLAWDTTNGNVVGDSVQFDYQGGSASQSLEATEGATLIIDNTISNRIGWGEPLPDTWSAIVNGVAYSGNTAEVIAIPLPTGHIEIFVAGIDEGFWAGWYGPIFTITQPVIEPTPEPTIEPSPEPSPTIEPTPEPTPTPSPTIEPTPTPSPEPTKPPVKPTLEPTSEPTPSPEATEPTPEPTPETSIPPVEPTPTPEPTIEPVASPEPVPTVIEPVSEKEIVAELLKQAEADDPVISQELAAIPLVGNVAEAVLDTFNALGNVGSDMTPEKRKESQQVIIASVIVGQISTISTLIRKP